MADRPGDSRLPACSGARRRTSENLHMLARELASGFRGIASMDGSSAA
jgi:hypothetical protein